MTLTPEQKALAQKIRDAGGIVLPIAMDEPGFEDALLNELEKKPYQSALTPEQEAIAAEKAAFLHRPNISEDALREGISDAIARAVEQEREISDGLGKLNDQLQAQSEDTARLIEVCKEAYEMMMEGGDRLVMASKLRTAIDAARKEKA